MVDGLFDGEVREHLDCFFVVGNRLFHAGPAGDRLVELFPLSQDVSGGAVDVRVLRVHLERKL